MKRTATLCAALSAAFVLTAEERSFGQAKNVIYMISDGMGFNTVAAAGYYTSGANAGQPFRGPGWHSQAMSTYPLRPDGP